MSQFSAFVSNRLKLLVQLLPAGRDIYLALARNRIDPSYRGLFDSHPAARKHAAQSRSNDYDIVNQMKAKNKEREEKNWESSFYLEDYAVLFWLSKVMNETTSLLELGGSIGKFFYSIQRFGVTSPSVRWTIAELPEAVKLGTTIAQEQAEGRLSFLESSRLGSADPVDVFLTAGTLQYMEDPLWKILESLAKLPTHILVHKLPVHEKAHRWTLQRLALCEVPYQIYSKPELLEQMTRLGYQHVDTWTKPRSIEIPFHRDMKIEGYLGFYFKR